MYFTTYITDRGILKFLIMHVIKFHISLKIQ